MQPSHSTKGQGAAHPAVSLELIWFSFLRPECQYLGIRLFYHTPVLLPLWKSTEARTKPSRCGQRTTPPKRGHNPISLCPPTPLNCHLGTPQCKLKCPVGISLYRSGDMF